MTTTLWFQKSVFEVSISVIILDDREYVKRSLETYGVFTVKGCLLTFLRLQFGTNNNYYLTT